MHRLQPQRTGETAVGFMVESTGLRDGDTEGAPDNWEVVGLSLDATGLFEGLSVGEFEGGLVEPIDGNDDGLEVGFCTSL